MSILLISDSFIIRDGVGNALKEILNTDKLTLISRIEEVKKINFKELNFVFVDMKKENIKTILNLLDMKERFNNIKIMILDLGKDKDLLMKCVDLKFDSYITTLDDKDDFIYIVKKIIKGESFYDSEVTKLILEKVNSSGIDILTEREKEVLFKVADGFNNKQIALNLNITEYTVKKHVSSMLGKLNLRSRKEAIIYFKDNHVLDAI